MQSVIGLLSRFRKDERGVFLVIFAILAVVLIAASGAVVDFTGVQQARTRAQTALDAAALALQSEIGKTGVTAATLAVKAGTILTEQLNDNTITATIISATPDVPNGKLTIQAYIVVPTAFVQLVGITSIRANLLSEVTRASSDLEVAVAADITYSMLGTKLTALKDALNSTIGLLVKTSQVPTYSKMAIAPYSNGVNVGAYADNSRGAITAGITISTVTWASGTAKTISAITKANPAIVTTSAAHGLVANDAIYINSVGGMTQVTNGIYCVGTSPTSPTTKFQLKKFTGTNCNVNVNSTSYSTYSGTAGRVTKCLNTVCELTVTTSTNHGFANNDYVYITGVTGMSTSFNNIAWVVKNKTNTTFMADATSVLMASTTGGTGTGGTAYCMKYGCSYYRFTNNSGGISTFVPTECAVERTTTTYGSLDTAPSTAPVGIQYAPADGIYRSNIINLEACPDAAIQPLTSNKTTLENLVTSLKAQGSTAGHTGLAWAWYMLSPNFISGSLGTQWPTDSKPAAYNKNNLVKAIILMTDGEFNTMYDYGVPSKDADLVNDATKTGTNAALGTSLVQGKALCTEIKKIDTTTGKPVYGILLYTIGFNISTGSAADTFLAGCATNSTMYKTATDAATLKKAFEDIAKSLSELRVSK